MDLQRKRTYWEPTSGSPFPAVRKFVTWPDGKCIAPPSRAATITISSDLVSCWFKDLIDLKPDGCAFHFVGSNPSHSPKACMTFARIPDRLLASALNMTDLKKLFAVLGLISIRLAICLVVYPCIRSPRASVSRCVKRNS